MLEEMRTIAQDVLGIEAEELDLDTCLAELGIDSMDAVELFMAFEAAFGVEFPEDFAPDTVQDIMAYVEEAQLEDDEDDDL